jgi:hypothetical protein
MADNIDFRVRHGLAVTNTATVESTLTSVSTETGALVVQGGAGIAKDVYVGGIIDAAGDITSGGALEVANTATILSQTESNNVTTGAVVVSGGAGIGKNLNVGGSQTLTGSLTVNSATQSNDTTTGALKVVGGIGAGGNLNIGGKATVQSTTGSISTQTGALVVSGGVGVGETIYVGKDLYVGGTLYGTVLGSISTATNLFSGSTGQIPYQTGPGATSFFGPGFAGQLLVSAGAAAPVYTNTGSIYVNAAQYANRLIGGATGSIPYQSGASITTFLAGGATGAFLKYNGSAPIWATTASFTGGTGNSASAGGQSVYVSSGGVGVVGNSYFANDLGVNGSLTIAGPTTFNNIVTFAGTATYVYSSNSVLTDSLLVLHANTSGGWTFNDNLDIGIKGDYYDTTLNQAKSFFFGFKPSNRYLEFLVRGTESSPGVFTGDYGDLKLNTILLTSTATSTNSDTGALVVPGGVGIRGNVNLQDTGQLVVGVNLAAPLPDAPINVAGNIDSYFQINVQNVNSGVNASADFVATADIGDDTSNYTNIGIANSNFAYPDASIAKPLDSYAFAYGGDWILATGLPNKRFEFWNDGTAIPGAGPLVTSTTGTLTVSISSLGMLVHAKTSATSTSTGALQVRGGVGIAGDLYIGGTIYGTASITGEVTTATNVAGGTAGQVLYQQAPGITQFFGPGTAGNILVSNGASAPSYNNTLTLTGVTSATSTLTGALQVRGGAGIGGNLYLGGRLGIKNTAINAGIDSVAGWAYDSTFSVANPTDIFFKPDGLVMYLAFAASITQYNLSVAWDITTAVAGTSFSMSLIDSATNGLFISPDGTKLITCGQTGVVIANGSDVASQDRAYYFTLGTPWDVSSATLVSSIRFALGDAGGIPSAMTAPQAVDFNNDGTIMYIVDSTTDAVHQFALSSAYNVGTATWTKQFSIAGQESGPTGLRFNSSGTRMYIHGSTGDDVNEYRLGTAWDIATAVFYDKFYTGWYEITPNGIYINESANVAFLCGSSSDAVLKFRTDRQGVEIDPETATSKIELAGNTRVTDNFYVSGRAAFEGRVDALGDLVTGGDITIGGNDLNVGSATAAASLFSGMTSGALSIATSQSSGAINIGGTAATGIITVGQSTAAQTLNLSSGATAAVVTKVVNIGTAGLAGSTSTINIGSTVAGALGVTTIGGTSTLIASTTSAISTNTGALQVRGGVGIGGSLVVGGTIFGVITTATNIAGGAPGSIPYQSSTGTTTFVPIGTSSYILLSNGTSPFWGIQSGLGAGSSDTIKVTNNVTSSTAHYLTFVSTSTGFANLNVAATTGITYIPSTNRLGINTNNPQYTLDVNSTTNAIIRANGTTTGGVSLQNSSKQFTIAAVGTDLTFYDDTVGQTRARFDTNGNFGVGGIPTAKFEVAGTVKISGITTVTNVTASVSTTTGALQVYGGIGVGDSVYVKNRVGFVNASNVSRVYQVYNTVTDSLDTVFA